MEEPKVASAMVGSKKVEGGTPVVANTTLLLQLNAICDCVRNKIGVSVGSGVVTIRQECRGPPSRDKV